jgi:hypothetical protein
MTYVINKQLLLTTGERKLIVLARPQDFNSEFHLSFAEEEALLNKAVGALEPVAEPDPIIVEPVVTPDVDGEKPSKEELEKAELAQLKARVIWRHGNAEEKARYQELKKIYG